MRRVDYPILLLTAMLALVGALVAVPASAQSAITGTPVSTCVSTIRAGDTPAALFRHPGRFDCVTAQTDFGQGSYWVLSRPLRGIADLAMRDRVRVASLWQERATLYALYPGGTIRRWSYDGRDASRHLQLGAIIEWRLPRALGMPERLLWRIDGSANLRGIVLAPRLATAEEAGDANMAMAAIYAGFAGLCFALLAYNLAMWGALRHRFQLAYCAMVAALLLYAFSSSGVLAWVFPTILNNDRLRLNYVLLSTAAATALLFARSFFPPKVTAGWVGTAATAVTATALAATAGFVMFAPWHIRLLDTLYLCGFFTMMLVVVPVIIRAWIERTPLLWLFAVAWAAPVTFAALRVFANMTWVGWSFWLDSSTILSMAFEAVISTLAIAYRIRLLALERDEAVEREIIAARLADTDPLTGLLNRRAFLRQAIGRDTEQQLILTDIDHFKAVNDTLGHDGGDEVLRVFARALRDSASSGALIARMGGEEFAILAPVDRAIAPETVLARLRAARMPFDIRVTASIGACNGTMADEAEWKTMYRRADRALFDAKQGGRDRVRRAA